LSSRKQSNYGDSPATFRFSDGEIDRASRLPEVFEDDKSYAQVFRNSVSMPMPVTSSCATKIQFRLQRLINEILDRGYQKYAFAKKHAI